MAKWRALPGELDPAVVEFVGQLRLAKDGSGLNLNRLAALTGYSTSSWERYLGGRSLAPREAVRAFARATGGDAVRLLAAQEAAAGAWNSGGQEQGPAEAVPGVAEAEEAPPALATDVTGRPEDSAALPAPGAGYYRRRHLVLTGALSAAVGALGALLVSQQAGGNSAAAAEAVPSPVAYHCAYVREHGQWFAGNSDTTTDPLVVDKSGPEVAELQCLLQHAGFSPGGVDGNFGPLTESAVIDAQKADHLDIDGQVGPRTWTALRG